MKAFYLSFIQPSLVKRNQKPNLSYYYVSACVDRSWNSLPEPSSIPNWLIRNLEKQGFQHFNVVQQKAIPVIFSGKDLVLVAPTGSGKTLAFLVPLLSLVDFKKSWIQALILVPTPELGFQIYLLAKSLCSSLSSYQLAHSREHSLIRFLSSGEDGKIKQKKLPAILISSSWRSKILGMLPSHSRQIIFSSATLQQCQHFLYQCRQQKWTKQDGLEYIHIDKTEWMPKVVHYYYVLKKKDDRIQLFVNIWRQQKANKAIVFIREDSMLSHTAWLLQEEWKRQTLEKEKNISFLWLSANADWKSRQRVMTTFCNSDAHLLLITGQLMRGLDIPEVTQVYNLEWMDGVEEYVHRAGRSARWLREGLVLNFVKDKELFALERVSNQLNIPFVEWPLQVDDHHI
ncbi:DEAD-box ATP-dependent RNA helicase 58, chloroplastic [Galdieria sulphuraria]|nr:DEAD-box ATP-dependent RNA helicase 58, chloroplastic [Galdieria sulphuraria]